MAGRKVILQYFLTLHEKSVSYRMYTLIQLQIIYIVQELHHECFCCMLYEDFNHDWERHIAPEIINDLHCID